MPIMEINVGTCLVEKVVEAMYEVFLKVYTHSIIVSLYSSFQGHGVNS